MQNILLTPVSFKHAWVQIVNTTAQGCKSNRPSWVGDAETLMVGQTGLAFEILQISSAIWREVHLDERWNSDRGSSHISRRLGRRITSSALPFQGILQRRCGSFGRRRELIVREKQ
jgi:hypothetical protein